LIRKPIKGKSGTRYINLAMIYFLKSICGYKNG